MTKENTKAENFKIIFSIISILLMIAPLVNGDNNYYRTLFIFLINRVFDMIFVKKFHESIFFVIWSIINQWFGAFACAVAFCLLMPDFANLFGNHVFKINVVLLAITVSNVLQEMILLIIKTVKKEIIERKFKSEGNKFL